jgi:hypothetical protein
MKRSLFILAAFLVLILTSVASESDTIHVITHRKVTIVTNPKSGENDYPEKVKFPQAELPVRKIILHLTLGSPENMKTAHWDYCDYLFLRKKSVASDQLPEVEIARMLTPYGSMFGKGWSFTWKVDVTDFSQLLRDSADIVYRHTGYEPDTLGWALTIDFEFITGPPAAKPLGIRQLFRGHYRYGDPEQPIEKSLEPVTFETGSGTGISRLRIQHTGHGMDEPRGCSEFCPRWREITIDSKMLDHRVLWKDCGSNPLYPQGGTWVYDRANWCPGDLQQPDIVDFSSSVGKHILKIDMEPYTAEKNIQAVENITAYLVKYSDPVSENDVALEEIVVPNSDPRFKRKNPACFRPEILVRNLGSKVLQSLTVVYGVSGQEMRVFKWKGELKYNEQTVIELPGTIAHQEKSGRFEVTLKNPNEKRDAWEKDNHIQSSFLSPPLFPQSFILRLKTNKHPRDNTFTLINELRDTVYRKLPENLKADSIYQDTLHLPAGQYQFSFTDTTGDGLEFWAEPDQGFGYLRFLDTEGRLLHAFTSDCGNGEMLAFRASGDYKKDTSLVLNTFTLYPRKVKDKTELDVLLDRPSKMTVLITIDGKMVEKHIYERIVSGTFPFYLGYLPKGRIIMDVMVNDKSVFKGRIMRDL